MLVNILRILIVVITSLIALTAIGGGIAILTGVDEFPLEWLRGTPFMDYTIPALILVIVVGGSALVAAITVTARLTIGVFASIVAGLMMAGYVGVEVLILKQVPPGPTFIEGMYFLLGVLVFDLGILFMRSKRREQLHNLLRS
jgi:hypothetical protein